MVLTKQMQRIVAREIRPYILPLPYFDYDDPVLIAAFLSDEDWFRWHKHLASCYIPLRTVCNAFSDELHLIDLLVADLLRERSVQLGNRQEWRCTKLDNEHNRRRIWGVVGVRTSCIDGSKERRVSASASVRGMLFANSSVPSTCVEFVFFQQQYAQHLLWLSHCRAAVSRAKTDHFARSSIWLHLMFSLGRIGFSVLSAIIWIHCKEKQTMLCLNMCVDQASEKTRCLVNRPREVIPTGS